MSVMTTPAVHHLAEDTLTRGDLRRVCLWAEFWLIGIAPAMAALTSARYFDVTDVSEVSAPAAGFAPLVGFMAGGGTALVAMVGFLAVLPRLRMDRRAAPLAVGFCLLAAASALAAWFGPRPSSATMPLALLIIGATWYVAPAVNARWLVRNFRYLTGFYALGSLVAALVAPEWAVQSDYSDSILPGISFRLHGMAPHAGLLASILFVGLIVDCWMPRDGMVARLSTSAACVALVLTQSKTILIAAVIVVLVELARRNWRRRRAVPLVSYTAGLVGVLAVAAVILAWTLLDQAVDGRTVAPTLWSRLDVWAITLNLWAENPVFGYGPQLWGPEMRAEYLGVLGWEAPHAHNQLVQTLGEAGIVGLAALVYYAVQVVRAGVAHAASTHGVSLAIVLFAFINAVTQCPLGRAGGDLFLPFVIYIVLLTAIRSGPAADDVPRRLSDV